MVNHLFEEVQVWQRSKLTSFEWVSRYVIVRWYWENINEALFIIRYLLWESNRYHLLVLLESFDPINDS